MQCSWHPDKTAVGLCYQCGMVFCEDCKVEFEGRTYCVKCKTKPAQKKQRAARAVGSAATVNPPAKTRKEFIYLGIAAAGVCVGWFIFTKIMPNILNRQSSRFQGIARAHVQEIAQAIERFTGDHGGRLPWDESQLTSSASGGAPVYLSRAYNEKTVEGYRYYVSLHPRGYEILAAPAKCHQTGDKVVMIKRGSPIAEADCE